MAIALLALPATASASHTFVSQFPERNLHLSLRGSHGYRISVSNEGTPKRVVLTARKGPLSAVYAVRGKVTDDRIEANFGRLGRVSVRFHAPTGKAKRRGPPRDCKGKPTIHEAGRFEGTIRFNGEEGFSSVSATSAEGGIVSKHRWVCTASSDRRPASARRPRPLLATRSAGHKHDRFIIREFAAVANNREHSVLLTTVNVSSPSEPSDFTLGEAVVTEHRGRIAIGRSFQIETEQNPVLTSPLGVEPITATVAAPPPLEGTGSYSESPGSPPSWTGDLSVHLPGGGDIPLTGSEFKVILCNGPENRKLSRCFHKLVDLLLPAVLRYPAAL